MIFDIYLVLEPVELFAAVTLFLGVLGSYLINLPIETTCKPISKSNGIMLK